MNYGIALHSIIPVRKEPREQAEMTSQLLFGECYTITGIQGSWVEIVTAFDQYRGWIDQKLLHPIDENLYKTWLCQPQVVSKALITTIAAPGGNPFHIPAGSSLTGWLPEKNRLQIGQYTFTILKMYEPAGTENVCTIDDVIGLFLNAPYLWGGRTPFGCDCSGFVQSVYKILSVPVARDAWQQAAQGQPVENLSVAKAGDLAFFGHHEGKITHVGILLTPDTIVHSSGYVHISPVDDRGIYLPETREYTHQLSCIRRFIS
ncbi:MAG: C40 family peptidase [Bacteroidales bacterium]|nr:C40 family peptidase [Bacteroidales bacterium]